MCYRKIAWFNLHLEHSLKNFEVGLKDTGKKAEIIWLTLMTRITKVKMDLGGHKTEFKS